MEGARDLKIVTHEVYRGFASAIKRTKENESWRGKIPTKVGFTKEDKEALNLEVLAIVAPLYLTEDDFEGAIATIIVRLFKKAYLWDAKPRNKDFLREGLEDYDLAATEYVYKKMRNQGMENFAEFLKEESKKASPKFLRVYEAARALGTLIEYEEMNQNMRPDSTSETRERVLKDINQFRDLEHFSEIADEIGEYGKIKTLLRTISWSRYTFRWQGYYTPIKCSILGHMLESAILSYLMNIEMGKLEHAQRDFWVMMFHDIPELWTDDVPSPVKDGITCKACGEMAKRLNVEDGAEVSLRKVTELMELDALENNFYPYLPKEIGNFFRNGVMIEDVDDAELKKFYKSADYFSADLEVWWNVISGSKEGRYLEILQESANSDRRTPEQRKFLQECLSLVEGMAFLD